MVNKKKKDDLKVVVVEYKVSMYCNACERTVAKTISKFKGVETFTTDMNKHKAVVTGRIDPQKLLKKLKKKTRKKVEILANKKDEQGSKDAPTSVNAEDAVYRAPIDYQWLPFFDCCKNKDLLLLFSEENPNACSIM